MCDLIIDNHLIKKDIRAILELLKSEITNGKLATIKYDPESVQITCPFHKDGLEKRPSCGIYVGNGEIPWGTTHCFTCGHKGQLWDVVASCLDISTGQAKKWLCDHFTESVRENNLAIPLDPPIVLTKFRKKETYLDESVLNNFQSWHPYMEKRKLSKVVCEKFQVKYDPQSECLVFPVRDIRGRLKFLTRRSVNTKEFIIDKNVEKEVYLLDSVVKNGGKTLYICESQINALTLQSYGYPAVALFGTGTSYQYAQIKKSEVLKGFLCLDGDDAGRKGTLKFIENFPNMLLSVVLIPEGKDVNDLTREEFENLKIVDSFEWLKMYNL